MSMFILQLGAIKWPINQNAFVMVRKAFNDGFLTVGFQSRVCKQCHCHTVMTYRDT